MTRISNLGRVLWILAEAEANEMAMHADVAAWNAPGECHRDVARGEAQRMRQARRHAEAVAKAPLRTICRQARKRGGIIPNSGQPKWQVVVGRVYDSFNLPF